MARSGLGYRCIRATKDLTMTAHADLLHQLRARKPGHTLPRTFYTSEEAYQFDLDLIWYKDWLFAGHDCEIAKPGSWFTMQVGAYPVVVLRDGVVRAFHNTCRHRGSRVCTADRGTAGKLVCPYHGWTYDLDGKLAYARDMGTEFDPSQHGLKPIACESSGGYIFICLARTPPDFAAFGGNMAPYFAPHHLADAKIAHENTIVENGNWKLVWENNRECYHCRPNHPELCRTFPEAPTVTGVLGADADPEIIAHMSRCEAAGLPSHFLMAETGQYRLARMPLLRDAVSYTMSGKAAAQRRLSDAVTEDRIGTLLLFHYPSSWNHVLGDHAVTFRVLPLGPTQTQVTTKWLVHKDAVEGVDYHIDELTHVWNATNDQDRRIVEENQRGVNSPAFEPGPYSPLHEGSVSQFVEWYAGAIERSVGTPRMARVA
jgi:Rieske 2Fe-2S family protein